MFLSLTSEEREEGCGLQLLRRVGGEKDRLFISYVGLTGIGKGVFDFYVKLTG